MSAQPDQELKVSGSWSVALIVFLIGQVAIWGFSHIGLSPEGFWVIFPLVQAYSIWVSYSLIKPRKRLFFNGKRILVCDLNGHKIACIEQPCGFCSPFFVGLRLSPWRSIGLMSWQMEASAFGKLLRWMRQSSASKPQRYRN